MEFYILDDDFETPVRVLDAGLWANWMKENQDAQVLDFRLMGDVFASLVFRGMVNRASDPLDDADSMPKLFELKFFAASKNEEFLVKRFLTADDGIAAMEVVAAYVDRQWKSNIECSLDDVAGFLAAMI